jgi:Spy/CpxP family protein refolding chaperone
MVIFACGVITGAMVTRTEPHLAAAVAPAPAAPPRTPPGPIMQLQRAEFLKRIDKQLDLSADQHEQIAHILKASQARTQPLWAQIEPQMREELKRVREEIRLVLTPDQRKKWAELTKKKPDSSPGAPRRPFQSTSSETNAL